MHQTPLIEDLAVVLCIAGIMTVLFQKIKQPTVLGYLIAGIIIGPYTPPFSLIDDEFEIKLLAELGIIFLMFSLGLEFTFGKLRRLGLSAVIIGLFEVVLMVILGFFAGKMLGWSPYECLLLGAALSISSTTIIVKALEEFNLKRFSFAELMVGVLLMEDLLAILLLVYVSTLGAPVEVLSTQIVSTSLKLLQVITSWFLVGYLALPYIMRKIQNYITAETLTIISVGLCLFLSSAAVYFNYSAALGAFIMGSILAETPLANKIEKLTLPIRDIFAAVFFVSVGMLIDPLLIMKYWPSILILSLITIAGKLLTSGLGALLAGQRISDSIRIGFSMAQIGEFSFIIVGLGSSLVATDGSLYPIVVAISAITTFATPYLIKLGLQISYRVENSVPQKGAMLLKKYHAWIIPIVRGHLGPKGMEEKKIVRFTVNAIIVAILATISAQVIIPRFLPVVDQQWPFQFIFWLMLYILASPFIWAMLFTYPSSKANKKACLLQILLWGITGVELGMLSCLYLSFPWITVPLGIVLSIYFTLFFQPLKRCYTWLENSLINNLTCKHELDETLLQGLAPWDSTLVKIKAKEHFPFIGQSLEECRLRPSFGINVVAIQRRLKTIWLPNAQERILPEDELVILGENEEINRFNLSMQHIEEFAELEESPAMEIQKMYVDANPSLLHLPISSSTVKQHIKGLIVGLERNGKHILNPLSPTILQQGDILLYIVRKDERI
ncbi:cation:proton antiporter [Neochlamydia sp. AcF95]|uniref:cation:proton antiporter domain-containing protein n=1 Tax=Neochlamydia sp. AcF95 TaxID=2795734 RepID=UPI001BC92E04|nr:cation:proton antiporter [Neochlamydia sp. AcF95]MBS4170785.1 Uncharacterized protein [Neochlamydia sp. AcF95]